MSKNKEVAVKQDSAIVPTDAKWNADFDKEDVKVSIVRLLQNTSETVASGKGKLGEMFDPKTGENLGAEMEVVILKKGNGAVYFREGEGETTCRSDNGIESVNGDTCRECPFGEYWGKPWKKGENPPGCSGSKTFVVVPRAKLAIGEAYPIMFSFLKTSYTMGKNLASAANQYPMFNKPIFGRSFVISSFIDKNPKGIFARYTFKIGTELTAQELAAVEPWYGIVNTSKVVGEEHAEEAVSDLQDEI